MSPTAIYLFFIAYTLISCSLYVLFEDDFFNPKVRWLFSMFWPLPLIGFGLLMAAVWVYDKWDDLRRI